MNFFFYNQERFFFHTFHAHNNSENMMKLNHKKKY